MNSAVPTTMPTPQNSCTPKNSPSMRVKMAPAMGFPVRPANEMMKYSVPMRTPISRTSEIWATHEGEMDTKAPDEKP